MANSRKHLKSGSEYPPLQENQLRLYTLRFCPFTHRTKLVLSAKNIPYEEVRINLADRPEWYNEKNPYGQVPTLEWIDNNTKEHRLLAESLIICDYIDEIYPDTRLHPTDPYLKAKHRLLIEKFMLVISMFCKLFRTAGREGTDEMNRYLTAYENTLKSTYFGGQKPAMLDYMIWPWCERLPLLKDVGYHFNADGKFPKLAAWIQTMQANEHVQRVQVPLELTKKFMEGFRQGKLDCDLE